MYNSLSRLPFIPYNIVVHLAQSPDAENLWKLLAYNDYDALSKPNLSFNEKMALVWKNGSQDEFSVFLTGLVEDAIAESRCIFKIYDYLIQPDKPYISSVVFAFDFLYGGKMSLVEYNGYPVSRGDLFVNILLTVLNGVDVNGVGTIIFSEDISRYSGGKYVVGNSKTFCGICVYLGILVGDSGNISCYGS